jgi:hypothetical protein
MPAPWNPNAPGVLGLEWRPLLVMGWYPTTSPVAMRIRSRSAETITKLRWPVRGSANNGSHMMIVDIYENGQETGYGGARSVEYAPIADTYTTGWTRVDGGPTNLYDQINWSPVHYPPVPGFSDRGIQTTVGYPVEYRCRVGSGAFPLTVKVMRLKMRYIISAGGYEWRDTDARLWWAGAGGPTIYNIPGSHVVTHYYGKLVELDFGEINPQTLAPWTPADVRAFSTPSGWELRIEGVGNTVSPVVLFMLGLEVTYSEVENRKASAIWKRPAIDMSTPRAIESDRIVQFINGTATINWVKENGKDYTFVHRMAWDPLVQYVAPRNLDTLFELVTDPGPSARQPRQPGELSFADVPIPGLAGAVATCDGWGRVVELNSSTLLTQTSAQGGGLSPTRLMAMLLVKAAGVSEDSQPYGTRNSFITAENRAYTGMTQYQTVTPAVNTSYIGVDFVVIPPGDLSWAKYDLQESTLTVQITTTGGSPVGGSFSITRAQAMLLPDIGYGCRRVQGWLSAGAALIGGTSYRITFSSDATASTNPDYTAWQNGWMIGTAGAPDKNYIDQGMPAPDGDLATFQGANGGTYQGVADGAIDLLVVLIQQPASPTASVAITTLTEASADHPQLFCAADAFEVAKVTWTASAYTGFGRWEVQREEADSLGNWQTLAYITSEALKSYVDYTVRRHVAVRYRVRAVLASGAFTEWHATAQVIPRPKGDEVVLTSDADPSLTVVVNRKPSMRYQFLNPEEDTFVSMAGKPYQTVFGLPVERGVRFEYDLLVNLVNQPTERGIDVFDALRKLGTSKEIPYVVVLDYEGERFYAHLQMASALREQPGHRYTTTVTITEVTDTPVVVTLP